MPLQTTCIVIDTAAACERYNGQPVLYAISAPGGGISRGAGRGWGGKAGKANAGGGGRRGCVGAETRKLRTRAVGGSVSLGARGRRGLPGFRKRCRTIGTIRAVS